ncbi:FHA domain-containing protein [Ramlibacter sp. XY19]|uniref:type VI secretion system-associated FHA domain protein n=1 Tax=Ramlibacter paludis TaxID=2908000 RepID=UPI0023D9B757|nr:type VI secretion system-associated FHA domain protein [Ramlibacter paludis]MCG2592480.1 FHA domain-containing protein [Ramlibacter paludis]
MPLELSVSGPGLDARCALAPGEPALVLGRDADCPVCLPAPQKNISRRHLGVWNEDNTLHFEVLSATAGIEVDGAAYPPGASGSLAPGQVLVLGDYRISVSFEPDTVVTPPDPWADFEKEAAQLVASVSATQPLEEDPFGEWGFQSTFAPGTPMGALDAGGLAQGGLASFFNGLGLPGAKAEDLTRAELEAMGRLTRTALQGLLQAVQAASASRQPAGADDRTTLEAPAVNPLRMETPLESKLWYLFGGQAAAAGCIAPDRAVGELVDQLMAHERAMGEALQEALAGVLEEFAPDALKARLLAGGSKLFESARAWDAYAKDYAEHAAMREAWIRVLLDRHFAPAYAQALLRVKRHTGGPPRG